MRDANTENYNYADFLAHLALNADIKVSIELEGLLYTEEEIIADSVEISGDLFSNNDISIGGTCSRDVQFSVIPKPEHRFSVVKNFPSAANPHVLGWYEYINGAYVLTSDETVVQGDTYYEETGKAVKKLSKAKIYLETVPTDRIPKGVYYVKLDSRDGLTGVYTFKGTDALGRLNKHYITKEETTGWPKPVIMVIQEICERFDIPLDSRTVTFFEEEVAPLALMIPYPGFGDNSYTCRDMISFIGAMLGGNWVMTDEGTLQFVKLSPDTRDTVQELGSNIGSFELKRLSDQIGGVQIDLMQEESESGEELYCEYVPYIPCDSTETTVDPEVLYFEQTDAMYTEVPAESRTGKSPVAEGWLYKAYDIPYVELIRGCRVVYKVHASVGETISFSYSQQGPNTVQIDWGDNSTHESSSSYGGGVEIVASHTYAAANDYLIAISSDLNGNWWNILERPNNLIYQEGKHVALETEVVEGRVYYTVDAYKRVRAGSDEVRKGVNPSANQWYELVSGQQDAPNFVKTLDTTIQVLPRKYEYVPVDLYDTSTWGDKLSPSTEIDNIHPADKVNVDWYEYDPSISDYVSSDDAYINYVYYSNFIPGQMVRYVIDVASTYDPVVVCYKQTAAGLVNVSWVPLTENADPSVIDSDSGRTSSDVISENGECVIQIQFHTTGKKAVILSKNPNISGEWWVTQRPSVASESVCRKYSVTQYYSKKDVTSQEYKFYYRRVLPEYQLIDPSSYDYENQNPYQNNWFRRKYGDKMIVAACPWITSDLLKRVFENVIQGFTYQAYEAEDTLISPTVELGDYISIKDVPVLFAHFNTTLGLLYSASISAPIEDDDVEAGDATMSLSERVLAKKISDMSSALRVSDDGIRLSHSTITADGEVISSLEIMRGGIVLEVDTESATSGEGSNLTLTLKVDGHTVSSGTVTITGNLDVSGELSAEALYAALGDIADLTVNSLTTSRRIPLYLTKRADDDNFIRAKDEDYEWVSGTVKKINGSPIRVQLQDPAGKLVFWDYTDGGSQFNRDIRDLADTQGSDVYIDPANGFPYVVGGGRIFTTTVETMFPVYVYDYTELVKARLGFDKSDDGQGHVVYIPILKLGAGDTSTPPNNYATISKPEDGLKINYRVPKTASHNPGKEIGITLGRDGFVTIYGERRPTDIDCTQWPTPGNTGQMLVQMQGEADPRAYNINVNAAGTKIVLTEVSSGHACSVRMPGYTEA